jgi:ABC-type transporter Mla maintaining outer membrane lipid asymmetry ATPase subunit MlaF
MSNDACALASLKDVLQSEASSWPRMKKSLVDSCACVQMGPSGSGKTTLLDVLAGRKTQGEVTGDILFSAQKPSINFLRRFTGYVEQFDTLLDILTVREMLLYTAEMKRSVKEPLSVKEAIVDKYISVLGLDVCKDTKIGNSMNRFACYYHRSLSLCRAFASSIVFRFLWISSKKQHTIEISVMLSVHFITLRTYR